MVYHVTFHPIDPAFLRSYMEVVARTALGQPQPVQDWAKQFNLPQEVVDKLIARKAKDYREAVVHWRGTMMQISVLFGGARLSAYKHRHFYQRDLSFSHWAIIIDPSISRMLMETSNLLEGLPGFEPALAEAMPQKLCAEKATGYYIPAEWMGAFQTYLQQNLHPLGLRLNQAGFEADVVLGEMLEMSQYCNERKLALLEASGLVTPPESDGPAKDNLRAHYLNNLDHRFRNHVRQGLSLPPLDAQPPVKKAPDLSAVPPKPAKPSRRDKKAKKEKEKEKEKETVEPDETEAKPALETAPPAPSQPAPAPTPSAAPPALAPAPTLDVPSPIQPTTSLPETPGPMGMAPLASQPLASQPLATPPLAPAPGFPAPVATLPGAVPATPTAVPEAALQEQGAVASLDELVPKELDKKGAKKWLKEKQKELDKHLKALKKEGMEEEAARAKALSEIAASLDSETPVAAEAVSLPATESQPVQAVAAVAVAAEPAPVALAPVTAPQPVAVAAAPAVAQVATPAVVASPPAPAVVAAPSPVAVEAMAVQAEPEPVVAAAEPVAVEAVAVVAEPEPAVVTVQEEAVAVVAVEAESTDDDGAVAVVAVVADDDASAVAVEAVAVEAVSVEAVSVDDDGAVAVVAVVDDGAVAIAAPVAAPTPSKLEELAPGNLDKKAQKKWLKEKQKDMDKQVKKYKKEGMEDAAAKARYLSELATSMTPMAAPVAASPEVAAAPAATAAEPEVTAEDEDDLEW